jgi:nucleoside-diphosphate-sugar epimerase
MPERFLVTGALGCIGAWTCRLLLEDGATVTGLDLGETRHRLELVASAEQLAALELVRGDITDLDQLEQTLAEREITHVVHLAALQVPFCQADPVLGARVNVLGTVNLFEAAKRHGLGTTIAFASSAAVYDEHGAVAPRTHYGVYKVANEGTARIYAADGIASIGLRPFVVYGPGRDQGITSTPTQAMLAAARAEPFRITYGGRSQFHYAPDVARAFIQAARTPAGGAAVYNLGGPSVHMRDVVAAIAAAAPGAAVGFDDQQLPFPDELPEPWFDSPLTPLETGVRETIERFRQ